MLIKNPLYRPADVPIRSQKIKSRQQKNWIEATAFLSTEASKCKLKKAVLYTNYVINNGVPAGMINRDTAATLKYLDQGGKAKILLCDQYYKVADNVAAIAQKLQYWRKSREQPVTCRAIIHNRDTATLFSS